MIDDQIDAVTRGFMGLTVTCARCHDHKFDPISIKDYYGLYGVFANSYEPQHPQLPVLTSATVPKDLCGYVKTMEERSAAYDKQLRDHRQAIQTELREFAGDYLVYVARNSSRHKVEGPNPLRTKRTLLRGPSAYSAGAIRRWRDFLQRQSPNDPVFGLWVVVENSEREQFPDALRKGVSHQSVNHLLRDQIKKTPPTNLVELARCYGDLLESIEKEWRSMSKVDGTLDGFVDPAKEELRFALYGAESPATLSEMESMDCYHLHESSKMRNLQGEIEKVSVETEDVPARPMLLKDRENLVEPYVFVRGQPTRRGEKVQRRLPKLLDSLGRDDSFSHSQWPAGTGGGHGGSSEPPDGSSDRQSCLGVAFRHTLGGDDERFWNA